METALVFNTDGQPIYWHVPPDRGAAYLPDSRGLWEILWGNREWLGGVAHTHPWLGIPGPSHIDLTTFAAIEAGLGQRLVWPIVSFDHICYCTYQGPGRLDYRTGLASYIILAPIWVEELRRLSGIEDDNVFHGRSPFGPQEHSEI